MHYEHCRHYKVIVNAVMNPTPLASPFGCILVPVPSTTIDKAYSPLTISEQSGSIQTTSKACSEQKALWHYYSFLPLSPPDRTLSPVLPRVLKIPLATEYRTTSKIPPFVSEQPNAPF